MLLKYSKIYYFQKITIIFKSVVNLFFILKRTFLLTHFYTNATSKGITKHSRHLKNLIKKVEYQTPLLKLFVSTTQKEQKKKIF